MLEPLRIAVVDFSGNADLSDEISQSNASCRLRR